MLYYFKTCLTVYNLLFTFKYETCNFRPDLKKIQTNFNYFPRTNLKNGIKKTLYWYKNNALKIN